jgi:SAM-dependent methyltransferase
VNNKFLSIFYPESRFGGYSDIDGTVVFYQRVNCLLSPDSRVLDFGCGWGDYRDDPVPLRRELRVFQGKVKKVIGVDVDPRGAANPFLDEFRLLEDQAPWPVESKSIDLVLSDNVLEHIQNPDWFFGESARVLVEGGYLCIRTPNVLSYVGLISHVVPNRWHGAVLRVAQSGRGEYFPTAYRCNTLWSLRRALARHGYEGVAYGYEAEPSYLNFSKLAYRLGVWHQRFAPGFLRPALFAFARLSRERVRAGA